MSDLNLLEEMDLHSIEHWIKFPIYGQFLVLFESNSNWRYLPSVT